ncbi:MAG: nuclear transport factor 2 family protein [Gemmatimonadaceae bacterium]|jgi:hypothetical protein|nr:nuclear transport factor 2 family protein [Gemmatimonadaceae bacterium]
MRQLVVFARAVAALCIAALAHAQPPAPTRAAHDSVTAVVQEFFRSMQAHDSAAFNRTVTPDAMLWAVRSGSGVTPAARPIAQFAASLATDRRVLLERMWNPVVQVHREIAMVWTPYDFHRDGAFSHCGIDAFTLVHGEGRWRITSITYTVEPTGCAPSPLGVPR